MKKIGIVSLIDIFMLPYANTYIDLFVEMGYEVDLIYWERVEKKHAANTLLNKNINEIKYKKKITTAESKYKKLFLYYRVIKFIRRKIEEKKYDGIIFLQTQPGIACFDILIKKYKKKYIFDIRDYSYEKNVFYRWIEGKVIKYSYKTIISSPAFRVFLPEHEYITAHNYTKINCKPRHLESENNIFPLQISFIGSIRFIEINKRIINLFADDPRFQLNFYGTGALVLKEYCTKKRIENCDFLDTFPFELTEKLYEKTNLINNIYGNNTPLLNFALSNKLYYAAQLEIPILVCSGTYMEKIVNEYKIGYVFDLEEPQIKEKLIDYYFNIDWNEFRKNCSRLVERVSQENEVFYQSIQKFAEIL